jgi:dolichol kinase
MSMASPSGMYAPRSARTDARADKRRVLERQREKPHTSRKLYHFANGAACFVLYGLVLSEKAALWTLGIVGGAFVVLDMLRLRSPAVQRTALRAFGKLMRREELSGLTANSWYVLGLLGAGLLFPKPYALLGLAFLAVGDPVAALVGTRWGRVPLMAGKSLEGFLANFLVSGLAAFAVTRWLLAMSPADALLVGLVGGAVSATVEAAPWPVNDNLAIPVVSAALLWAIMSFVGVPLVLPR